MSPSLRPSGDIRRFPDDDVTIIMLMNLSEPYAATIGDQIVQTIFANSAAQNKES
jgi:hypothetical protein